jgi:hypothetical protein
VSGAFHLQQSVSEMIESERDLGYGAYGLHQAMILRECNDEAHETLFPQRALE